MKTKTFFIVVVSLAVVALAYVGIVARGISSASSAADLAWKGVEEAYSARYGLMADLEAALSGKLGDEGASSLAELSAARARYASAGSPDERALAAGDVEAAYTALLLAVEDDQAVRALRPVQSLVAAIAGTEAGASAARTAYNAAVREYNQRSGRLPGNEARSYFQSADGI